MSELSDYWRERAAACDALLDPIQCSADGVARIRAKASIFRRCADELDASGMIEPPAPRKQAGSVCKACFGNWDQWRWDAAKKRHIAVPCEKCGASKETEREIK